MGLGAPWDSGRCPCPWQVWHWMGSKVLPTQTLVGFSVCHKHIHEVLCQGFSSSCSSHLPFSPTGMLQFQVLALLHKPWPSLRNTLVLLQPPPLFLMFCC